MSPAWKKIALLLAAGALAVLAAAPEPEASSAGGGAMVEIPDRTPVVALTFDDGPWPGTTERLLDGLALRETPATFFLVGVNIPGREALVRRMAAEGHQVGVHSYSHARIRGLSRADFDCEVGKVRAQLSAILGGGEFWLRPPYGAMDDSVRLWADSPIILWSVYPEDWKDDDVDRKTAHVLSHVRDGDIILFHDIFDSSVDAALRVVDALEDQGYCFVTVEQLLARGDVQAERGAVYRRLE